MAAKFHNPALPGQKTRQWESNESPEKPKDNQPASYQHEATQARDVDFAELTDLNGRERRDFRKQNEDIGRHLWFETRIRQQSREVQKYTVNVDQMAEYEEDYIYSAIAMVASFQEKLRGIAQVVQKKEAQRYSRIQQRLETKRRQYEEAAAGLAKEEYRRYQLPAEKPSPPKLGF